MKTTTRHDPIERVIESITLISDREVMVDENAIAAMVRAQVVESIAGNVMERIGPAIDKALNEALKELSLESVEETT